MQGLRRSLEGSACVGRSALWRCNSNAFQNIIFHGVSAVAWQNLGLAISNRESLFKLCTSDLWEALLAWQG
jgi:hypothetical protein